MPIYVQVLLSKGISEDDLEAELEQKLLDVDRMRTYDEGVNSVLIASAADEVASLRHQIDQQANEIEQLKDRWGVLCIKPSLHSCCSCLQQSCRSQVLCNAVN